MNKETYYFSHDYTARTDAKIKKLLQKHGYLGYGLYWALIEDLYLNDNCIQYDIECIAFDLRTNEMVIESIINDFNLFDLTNGTFSSISVQKRMEKRNEKSERASLSASKRWNNANAMQTQCDSNALNESKVNESKVNKSKLNNINNNISKNFEVMQLKLEKKSKMVSFEKSDIFDFDIFKTKFNEWSPEKIKHYYESALAYSESKGVKYINWTSAIKNWDRKNPYLQTKNKNNYEQGKNERDELRKRADNIIANRIFDSNN
jgi:hypothetical protein